MIHLLANLPGESATQGILFAPILLIVWPLVALIAFYRLAPGRAILAAYLTAWLFLPQVGLNTPFVSYDKVMATSLGALLAALIAHPRPLMALRPAWFDLPIIVWCLAPGPAALTNGLTAYDAAATMTGQFCTWGIPYVLGRAYLTTWADARDLAKALFIAGLVYVPFCLAEVRLSPFWHNAVYHVWQHSINQTIRGGGWRPMVFMQHGLAVGLFMSAASLAGAWLWWSGALPQVWRLPTALPLVCLWGTTVLVKSTGALVLLLAGGAALLLARWTRLRVFLLVLWLIPPFYVASRTVGGWTGDEVTSEARHWFEPDRVQSLQFRFDNENRYVAHAREKPLFGYGYNFVLHEDDQQVVVDSLWIITLSTSGGVGIVALLALFALPIGRILYRVPVRQYGHPAFAGATAVAVVLLMYGLDNLVNAMFNPAFVLGLGALSSLSRAPVGVAVASPGRRRLFRRRRARQVVAGPRLSPAAAEIDPALLAPGILSLEEKSE